MIPFYAPGQELIFVHDITTSYDSSLSTTHPHGFLLGLISTCPYLLISRMDGRDCAAVLSSADPDSAMHLVPYADKKNEANKDKEKHHKKEGDDRMVAQPVY